jgi:hypothetical protein
VWSSQSTRGASGDCKLLGASQVQIAATQRELSYGKFPLKKTTGAKQRTVKVRDLKPRKDAKGGTEPATKMSVKTKPE